MKISHKIVLFILFLAGLLSVRYFFLRDYLTIDTLRENVLIFRYYVDNYYAWSAAAFLLITVLSSFVLPGAILLTVSGGYFFGTLHGALYSAAGITAGSALAFLTARYVLGGALQSAYSERLRRFNDEIERNGHLYLIALRVSPVAPSFLINFLAGLTVMPLKTFLIVTFLSILPGSFVYSFAGRQLSLVSTPGGLLSGGMVAALALIGLFSLVPMLLLKKGGMRG